MSGERPAWVLSSRLVKASKLTFSGGVPPLCDQKVGTRAPVSALRQFKSVCLLCHVSGADLLDQLHARPLITYTQ
jgi:hypothetical protein